MSKEFHMSDDDSTGFSRAFGYAKKLCNENSWAVGVGEMAIGAGLVAWGVHNGFIEMGSELVVTAQGGENVESIVGAVGGSGLGAVAGSIIGSIGVAGMGGAIGIPATLVIGGAAAVLGMTGYAIGDISHNIFNSSIDYSGLVGTGSALLIGAALIVHGARRFITDKKILSELSKFKKNILYMSDLSSKIIATTMEELRGFIDELIKSPQNKVEASLGAGSSAIGAGIGASAGGAAASGLVTVFGSKALGGVAVSLGLISAPVWPIIAGISGGAGIGYAAFKAIKYWSKSNAKQSLNEQED